MRDLKKHSLALLGVVGGSMAMLSPADVALAQSPAAAQQYEDWLRDETEQIFKDAVVVAAGATSSENQNEAPAAAANSSTLVDTSSASDFVSIALNLAGLTGSSGQGGEKPTSASATVSGYALYAAARGISPLDTENYCNAGAQRMRWFAGTLGFEDQQGGSPGAILAGAKVTIPFLDFRNVCDEDAFDDLDSRIANVADSYAVAVDQVADGLYEAIKDKAAGANGDPGPKATFLRDVADRSSDDFLNCLTDNTFGDDEKACVDSDSQDDAVVQAAFFHWVLETLGPEASRSVLTAYAGEETKALSTAEKSLSKAAAKAARERDSQWKFAAQFDTRQVTASPDEYTVKLVMDGGIPKLPAGLTLVLNGGWQRKPDAAGVSRDAGTAALALEYTLPRELLTAVRPTKLSLAANGEWRVDLPNIYKGQASLILPVPRLTGVEIPLSVTIANRTELIDEAEIRGLMGFTVDTSRLFNALVGSGGPFALLPQ